MPRPGPRPYECHRRAWHSDRHQPMRGSLIQEMFRVANQIHTSQTKKNREWQEKLPTVVLKAEEIMYSKANSEAEYMDFQTLWERTNDAINTIIRREEATETGDCLQPCIEAALILGCNVRRASRSQRNSNPRSYLSPNIQEATSGTPQIRENVIHGGSSRLDLHSDTPASSPHNAPRYSSSTRPVTTNSTQLHSMSSFQHTQDDTPTIPHAFPVLSDNFPASVSNQVCPMGIYPSVNLGRVFPLYYGAHVQTAAPEFVFQPPQSTNSNSAILGETQAQCILGPHGKGTLLNFFTCDGTVNASSTSNEADLRSSDDNPPEIECDLSLRLGSVSYPHVSIEASCIPEAEDNRSSSSEKEGKSCDPSSRKDKELSFFPRENVDDSIESSSSKWTSKGKGLDLAKSTTMHETLSSNLAEDGYVFGHPKFSPDMFFGRMKKPDK